MAVILPILARLLPGGGVENGEFRAANPRHPDSKRSLCFHVQDDEKFGVWKDFAQSDPGGRWPASFVAYVENVSCGEAFSRLEALLGLRPWRPEFGDRFKPLTAAECAAAPPASSRSRSKPTAYTPIVIPPERERELPGWLHETHRGGVTATWLYRDADVRPHPPRDDGAVKETGQEDLRPGLPCNRLALSGHGAVLGRAAAVAPPAAAL
jgi:hypothetical protein